MKIKQLGLTFLLVFMLSFSSLVFVVADSSINQYWNFGTTGVNLGTWVMNEGSASEFYANADAFPTDFQPRSYPWFLINVFTNVTHVEDKGRDSFNPVLYYGLNISGSNIWNVFANSDDGDKFELELFASSKAGTWVTDYIPDIPAGWNFTGGKTLSITISTVVRVVDGDTYEFYDTKYLRNDTYTWTSANYYICQDTPYGTALTYTPPDSVLNADRVILYIYSMLSVTGNAFDNVNNLEKYAGAYWFLDDVRVTNWGVGSKTNLGKDVGETPVTEDDLAYVYPFEWDNPDTPTVYYYPTYCGFNFQNNFTESDLTLPSPANVHWGTEIIELSGDVYKSIPYSLEFEHSFKKNSSYNSPYTDFTYYPTMNLTFTNPNDDSLLSVRFNSRIFYVSGTFPNANMYKNINITVKFLTNDGTLIQETPIRNLRFFEANKTSDDSGFVTGMATLSELGFNVVNVQIIINSSLWLNTGIGTSLMSKLTYKTYIDSVSSNWESGFWNPLTNIPYPNNIPIPTDDDDDDISDTDVGDWFDRMRAGLGMGTVAGGFFLSLILILVFLGATMMVSHALKVAIPSMIYAIILVGCIGLCTYMTLLPSWVIIATLIVIAGLGVRGYKKVFT